MNGKIRSKLLLTALVVIATATLAPIAASTPRSALQLRSAETATCGIVAGAPWSLRGSAGSGSHYMVTVNGVTCSNARKWVPGLTHQSNPGPGKAMKSPSGSGFRCRAIATIGSGDNLAYGGVCMPATTGHAFFEWSPVK